MKLTAVCREAGGWIDLYFLSEDRKLETDSGTATFDQLVSFIGSGGYTELEVEAVIDRPLPHSRCFKVFSFVQQELEKERLDLKLTFKEYERVDPEDHTDRYERGIRSYITGIYPHIPLQVVKHIYVENAAELPFVKRYVRKTAINSAVIIEVGEAEDPAKLYELADCPNIVHFKTGDVYRLNYPGTAVIRFSAADSGYEQVKREMLAGRLVPLTEGAALADTPEYFEQEGGRSINRIALLSSGGFRTRPGQGEAREYYEIDSIEVSPVPLLSLVVFDSGMFAALCRFERYCIEPEEGEPYRFRIGNGSRTRTLDLAAGQIV